MPLALLAQLKWTGQGTLKHPVDVRVRAHTNGDIPVLPMLVVLHMFGPNILITLTAFVLDIRNIALLALAVVSDTTSFPTNSRSEGNGRT